MSNDLNTILAERGAQYGDFSAQARLSQRLKSVVRDHRPAGLPLNASQTESMEMILHKIARIVNGNPDNEDSWRDIAGYATLIADQLGKGNGGVKPA